MTNCRISIALATYNGAKYLSELLESLCQQTVKPYEVVIVDDCSVDDTITVVEKYYLRLPIIVYTNKVSIGVVQNFQRAVAECNGEYIAFCDQDDIWLPNKLEDSIKALNQLDNSKPTLVFTDLTVVDKYLNEIDDSYWKHRKLRPAKETFGSLIYGNFVTGCTMVINQSMAKEITKMPADVIMHDFWIACIAYGIGQVTFIDQPTILYRQHSSNVTSNDAVTLFTRWKRLLTLLTDTNQAISFLDTEINQARKFVSIYGLMLSSDKQVALNKLISLRVRSPVLRKLQTFMIKFLHIHS